MSWSIWLVVSIAALSVLFFLPCPCLSPPSRAPAFTVVACPVLASPSLSSLFLYCTSLACPVLFVAVFSGPLFSFAPCPFLSCSVFSAFCVRIVVWFLVLAYHDISCRGKSWLVVSFHFLSPLSFYLPACPVSFRRVFSRSAVSCRVVSCGAWAAPGCFLVASRPVLSFHAMSCFFLGGLPCCVFACLVPSCRAFQCVEMFLARYAHVTPCRFLFPWLA